jgi:hypothetical protein
MCSAGLCRNILYLSEETSGKVTVCVRYLPSTVRFVPRLLLVVVLFSHIYSGSIY